MLENSGKSCVEDPRQVDVRKRMAGFVKKFNVYMIFSVIY